MLVISNAFLSCFAVDFTAWPDLAIPHHYYDKHAVDKNTVGHRTYGRTDSFVNVLVCVPDNYLIRMVKCQDKRSVISYFVSNVKQKP